MTSLAACGTTAAYRRHLRHQEPTCALCRAAQAAVVASYRGRPAAPRELRPCGTEAAYRRHLRYRDVPCRPCTDAHNVEVNHSRRVAA